MQMTKNLGMYQELIPQSPGPGLAIPTLALQSPRLMGEATYMLGQGARLAEKPFNAMNQYGIPPGLLGNVLYQSGRLPNE